MLRKKISCTPVEDTFRFHLMPELSQSDLPPITRSVLKTRSTLGLNKVYKYLFKRLLSLNIEGLQRNPNAHNNARENTSDDNNDSFPQDNDTNATVPESEECCEILCNGHYVSS